MKVVEYNQWKIKVDVEKTKEYYDKYIVKNTQANRNMAKYCENLCDEEKDFFETLAINPVCCDVSSIGVSKKGEFPCGGRYIVIGEYEEAPDRTLIPAEEFIAKGFIDERPDPSIYVGNFEFDFLTEELELEDLEIELPEGALVLEFWCENMKWLLDEECGEKWYEPEKPWELHKILARTIRNWKESKRFYEEMKSDFESAFEELGIEYKIMSRKEVERFKRTWVCAFSPVGADMRKVKKQCLKGRGYCVFLWHLFSFEFQKYEECEAAEALFDGAEKENCILLDNNCGKLAYKLSGANELTAKVLENFIDVTVTSEDYQWTYSKTHESACGPYFYRG